jgi:hypothetical protein
MMLKRKRSKRGRENGPGENDSRTQAKENLCPVLGSLRVSDMINFLESAASL